MREVKKKRGAHLSGLAGTHLSMQLVERERGITAGRFGALVRDVADPGRGHTNLFPDLRQLESRFLQVPYSFGPCVHGKEITGSRSECQRHTVTEFRLNGNMEGQKRNATTFGGRVKEERELRGMSREDLCDVAGIPYSTLAGIEGGDQDTSTIIDKLALALGTTPRYLREGGRHEESEAPPPEFSPREIALIQKFRDISKPDKIRVETFLGAMRSRRASSGKARQRESVAGADVPTARARRSG